jgi:hypothetical protein
MCTSEFALIDMPESGNREAVLTSAAAYVFDP